MTNERYINLTLIEVINMTKKKGSLTVQLFPSKFSPGKSTLIEGYEVDVFMKGDTLSYMGNDGWERPFENIVDNFKIYNCSSMFGTDINYYIKE